MGRTHARTLAGLPGVEMIALCDADRAAAAKLRDEIKSRCPVHEDFAAMLAADRPDALFVCLPPFAQRGQAVQAAQAGVHLFLEKPIALDLAEAEAIVSAAQRSRVVTQVGYHMRHSAPVQRLLALAAAGEAGRPIQFQGRFWTRMDGSPWWRDRSRSGGQVVEQLIHLYNLAAMFMGEVESASGILDNLCHRDRNDYTIEDSSLGVLRHRNGAISSISGTNCAVEMHFFADFRAVFERVTLEYRCNGQTWVEPDTAVLFHADGRREPFTVSENLHRAEVLEFLVAVRAARPTGCPAEVGLADLRTVLKVVESAGRGGVPVRV
jgi:predicted dehydrogenase